MARALVNGHLYADTASALYMDEGMIVRIGSDEEIRNMCTKEDEIIDLHGMYVYPGFIGPHVSLTQRHGSRNQSTLHEISEIRTILQEALTSRDLWTVRDGLEEGLIREETKQLLDGYERPVVFYGPGRSWCVANKAALKKADLDENTMIPDGSIDHRTGLLEGQAVNVLQSFMPAVSPKEIEDNIRESVRCLNANGFTSAGSCDFGEYDWKTVIDVLMRMSYQGTLKARIDEQCVFAQAEELAHFLDEGYTTDVGDDRFKIGHLFVRADNENGDVEIELANSYNMPALIDDETWLDEMCEAVLEGNPLGYALILDTCDAEAVRKAKKKQVYLIGNHGRSLQALNADGVENSVIDLVKQYTMAGYSASEVIDLLSRKAALILRTDSETGAIREGYRADLCIIDGDLEKTDEYDRLHVVMTLLDGETVFER